MQVNPLALLAIGLATCIGALLGSWLLGLTIGLTLVLLVSVTSLRG